MQTEVSDALFVILTLTSAVVKEPVIVAKEELESKMYGSMLETWSQDYTQIVKMLSVLGPNGDDLEAVKEAMAHLDETASIFSALADRGDVEGLSCEEVPE